MKRQERIRGFFWNCNPQDVEIGPGGRSRERGESKGTSRFTREEPGAASSPISRTSGLSGRDAGRGASCPLGRMQSALGAASSCLFYKVPLAPGGWTFMPGLGLAL